ncbi:cytochrome P450 4d2-like isoform X2 [Anastrepha ludens]|uniref:cytochrome P450 4d2-like isoform X2 n=2 Tax=Anastrepha ludens TaxID=28586 RepID=UPI0023B040CA|nr:cytochrome P450 4d2-like isoform X2 [Anastrepha ludens]
MRKTPRLEIKQSSTKMFFELILFALSTLFIWEYFFKKHRNELLSKYKVPGPPTVPIFGNALYLRNWSPDNIIAQVYENRAKYGKIHRFWVLHQLTVFVMDAKYMEFILSSQQLIKKSSSYDFLECWLGRGLLLSTGKKWHTRRKIITPTFHFKILEEFVEIFDQQSSVMIKKLKAQADGTTVINIFPIVCLTALDIIAETAMGVKVYAQDNPDIEYVRALASIANTMAHRFLKPTWRLNWLFRLVANSEYKKMVQNTVIMHKFTNKVIVDRRAALEKKIIEDDVGSNKKRMALLDVLLQATQDGKPLSDEDIREEVDTFMFEGHDTTTSGISFCLYLISRHPEVQNKLVEEINEVIGTDKTRTIGLSELHDLKYLDCTIKESLRLFPSVPSIGRETTEDVQLGDIVLPAKTNITLSLFMILRDPDYFPDPEAFKPERFNSESDAKISHFAYTPFSAGPRNCIGQKFAVYEMKSTISKILRNFEILPAEPDVKPIINLVTRSSTGVNIKLRPRTE